MATEPAADWNALQPHGTFFDLCQLLQACTGALLEHNNYSTTKLRLKVQIGSRELTLQDSFARNVGLVAGGRDRQWHNAILGRITPQAYPVKKMIF